MAVNDKIAKSDYNTVQQLVSSVLGNGANNRGYGQVVQSSPVDESNSITVNEWAALKNDLINCIRHQTGTIPTLPDAVANETIKYDNTTEPYERYLTESQTVDANRFNVANGQFTITDHGSGSYNGFWRERAQAIVTLEFGSADQARFFFNAGGTVRILSQRTGGNATGDIGTIRAQNEKWTELLETVGTYEFGAVIPETGIEPNDAQNFYRLGGSYQLVEQFNASSPYGANVYQIFARTPGVSDNSNGDASTLEFLIRYQDDHPPTGIGPDGVDGELKYFISTKNPIFNMVPATVNAVDIPVPDVTVRDINVLNVDPDDASTFRATVSSDTTNLDIRTFAQNSGWNGSDHIVITIASGVVVSGDTAGDSTAACTISGSFPSGVSLINNGTIVGRGGNGGSGGSGGNGSSGSPGGTALTTFVECLIDNQGTIAGGGGGGGGGGFAQLRDKRDNTPNLLGYGAGGGGGQSSLSSSSGGSGPSAAADGAAGTFTSEGAGGSGSSSSSGGLTAQGGSGGRGGNWGENGLNGGRGIENTDSIVYDQDSYLGGFGGLAGLSVKGANNVAFRDIGTVLGRVSN